MKKLYVFVKESADTINKSQIEMGGYFDVNINDFEKDCFQVK